MADKEETGETVGTQNGARFSRLSQIADSADEFRDKELSAIPDDDEDDGVDPDNDPDGSGQRETIADEDDVDTTQVDKKHTIKVNGREIELTVDELIARAQKVESADQYLAAASEALRSSALAHTGVQPSAKPAAEPEVEQDDLALVRAIQMGTEEEAVKALRQIRARPSATPDDLGKIVDERLNFQSAVREFASQYPAIVSNPLLSKMASMRDSEMIASGDKRGYAERYKDIGEELTEKLNLPRKQEETPDKLARKVETRTPPKAAARQAPRRQEGDEDDSTTSVVAKMAKARGQARAVQH